MGSSRQAVILGEAVLGGAPGTAGGKVDVAGGVWEAEPGVCGDAVVGDAGPGRQC